MVGVGAIVGTLSGGNTNAARSPDVVPTGAIAKPVSAVVPAEAADANPLNTAHSDTTESNTSQPNTSRPNTSWPETTTVAIRRAPADVTPNEPAPAAIIAERFPTDWQQQHRVAPRVVADDNDPPQALGYASEPQRAEPVRPAAASTSGYRLASIDPTPVPMPKPMARPAQPKPAVLFNDAQLASIKARLKLTADQQHHWAPVEQALRAISWKLATQQNGKRTIRGNQASMIDPNSPEVARLKSAAFPLIMSMREDQKREVRQLAHTMGLKQVASMF
jgi:hypothetical protein